jgi:hypothetical protein
LTAPNDQSHEGLFQQGGTFSNYYSMIL